MLQNDIRRADAVRHMSVDAGTRTADRADSHGHRPQNTLTCQNTQGRPPWVGEEDAFTGMHPQASDLYGRTLCLDFAGYSPQRRRLIGYSGGQEPGARPNAIPEITNRGVSARPHRRDGRVGGAAS
jgi:hypothetical protein